MNKSKIRRNGQTRKHKQQQNTIRYHQPTVKTVKAVEMVKPGASTHQVARKKWSAAPLYATTVHRAIPSSCHYPSDRLFLRGPITSEYLSNIASVFVFLVLCRSHCPHKYTLFNAAADCSCRSIEVLFGVSVKSWSTDSKKNVHVRSTRRNHFVSAQ